MFFRAPGEGRKAGGDDNGAEAEKAEGGLMSDVSRLSPGSVSRLLGGLRDGDEEAVRQLWLRYFQPLVRLARTRLPGRGCAWRDAEDVALEAFWALCEQVARPGSAERFPELHNRTHLWKLLACFTARRAFDLARKEGRRSRVVADESALGEGGFEPFAGREPPPEFTAAVADLLECLPSDELRRIALARMEGCTNPEVARRLGRSLGTIERKLQVIRVLWQDVGREAP
jgi:DNA-directed RNA polymerase specialized sigma24 family protein